MVMSSETEDKLTAMKVCTNQGMQRAELSLQGSFSVENGTIGRRWMRLSFRESGSVLWRTCWPVRGSYRGMTVAVVPLSK